MPRRKHGNWVTRVVKNKLLSQPILPIFPKSLTKITAHPTDMEARNSPVSSADGMEVFHADFFKRNHFRSELSLRARRILSKEPTERTHSELLALEVSDLLTSNILTPLKYRPKSETCSPSAQGRHECNICCQVGGGDPEEESKYITFFPNIRRVFSGSREQNSMLQKVFQTGEAGTANCQGY